MLTVEVARFRAAVLRTIRAFFDERGYIEVDTPVMAPSLIPEAHIEVFATEVFHPDDSSPERVFLVPSPEIWMKRLLAAGYGNLYYLGKVFRNGESRSRIHRPEFTMLEWYAVNADYEDQAVLTEELLQQMCRSLAMADDVAMADSFAAVGAAVERLTVAESFTRFAGLESPRFGEHRAMAAAAESLGLSVGSDESEEDLYQRILLTFVEPKLPVDRPVMLFDYPALVPTLAKTRGVTSERWELYLAGMEIANCYTEERDPQILRDFVEREHLRKLAARVPHPPASLSSFAAAPPCSGVALGVDRLVMALLGLRDIGGVIFSP